MGYKRILIILISLVLLTVLVAALLFYLLKSKTVKPKFISKTNIIQSSLEQEYKTYFVDLKINLKDNSVTKVNAGQKNTSHQPLILSEKPKPSDGYFIFQTKLLSNSNNMLYTSWNRVPMQFINGKEAEIKLTVFVPYIANTILQIYSSDGKVIFTEIIK